MTYADCFDTAILFFACASLFLFVLFGDRVPHPRTTRREAAPPEPAPPALFAEEYLRSLDALHTAISTAHVETRPGPVSPDLGECWAIWHAGPDDDPS
ncbi:hypothetical protein AB0M94_34240 [Streptomyces xanthochromogenes]|uniref:Uncharacterized protein n=1 Tax=Streptomyces xanthochromogenes TaxID=67384 RepID=A0ABQ3ATL2_9ACTN|nr:MULTISPECIES: hypothetical protein [Streptomyces]MYV93002.1 hypothetical protein [Streptomyces sp. SID1034]GGY66916.1 hypothetical protein GCM10010326_71790 [Streptomyces xanthochromogenes]